jgi:hypothetical protein
VEIQSRLSSALDCTEAYILAHDYRGWDPYDGLATRYWSWPGLRSARRLRWAWQQVVKRSPIVPRTLLGIRPGRNPVTLALCLQAYADRDETDRTGGRSDRAAALVSELAALATRGWSGPCWGYDFFWEARYCSNPPFQPTVVATGFVANGLWEAHRTWDLSQAADLIRGAASFVDQDLNRIVTKEGFCWSYSPFDDRAILNATLKGARICAQAYALGASDTFAKLAKETAYFVAAHQRPDGSWPYSTNDERSWADNFHTGYVLDCLDEVIRLTDAQDLRTACQRGYAYYLEHFFEAGTIPRYYDHGTYPIDATACGQSLLTLVRFGQLDQACRVAEWCLDNLALPDGSYIYQVHPRWRNRQIFMRWSVAWMFAGLARLEHALAESNV